MQLGISESLPDSELFIRPSNVSNSLHLRAFRDDSADVAQCSSRTNARRSNEMCPTRCTMSSAPWGAMTLSGRRQVHAHHLMRNAAGSFAHPGRAPPVTYCVVAHIRAAEVAGAASVFRKAEYRSPAVGRSSLRCAICGQSRRPIQSAVPGVVHVAHNRPSKCRHSGGCMFCLQNSGGVFIIAHSD
ncbi:hypothetical protein BV20DRAFT_601396 [Pilatotrama ljubarskyi]|nr:hypothetical protein BV20DRAFT_601396 [Pilatotrama ljubarskyi]